MQAQRGEQNPHNSILKLTSCLPSLSFTALNTCSWITRANQRPHHQHHTSLFDSHERKKPSKSVTVLQTWNDSRLQRRLHLHCQKWFRIYYKATKEAHQTMTWCWQWWATVWSSIRNFQYCQPLHLTKAKPWLIFSLKYSYITTPMISSQPWQFLHFIKICDILTRFNFSPSQISRIQLQNLTASVCRSTAEMKEW